MVVTEAQFEERLLWLENKCDDDMLVAVYDVLEYISWHALAAKWCANRDSEPYAYE